MHGATLVAWGLLMLNDSGITFGCNIKSPKILEGGCLWGERNSRNNSDNISLRSIKSNQLFTAECTPPPKANYGCSSLITSCVLLSLLLCFFVVQFVIRLTGRH